MARRKPEKGESDVAEDRNVAGSREGKSDSGYVGRRSSEDAFDAGTTGAEARGEEE